LFVSFLPVGAAAKGLRVWAVAALVNMSINASVPCGEGFKEAILVWAAMALALASVLFAVALTTKYLMNWKRAAILVRANFTVRSNKDILISISSQLDNKWEVCSHCMPRLAKYPWHSSAFNRPWSSEACVYMYVVCFNYVKYIACKSIKKKEKEM
jgi:hypothetical protein